MVAQRKEHDVEQEKIGIVGVVKIAAGGVALAIWGYVNAWIIL